MNVKTENLPTEDKQIVDDISDPILAGLKAKLAAKNGTQMPITIVETKKRSIKLGIVGSGQAGGRLAQTFYALGYPAVAINTATQDLQGIKLPDDSKLLLQYGLGGASKDLAIGHQAADAHKDAINELVVKKLDESQVLLFCTSLGGGSGAGSCEVLIDILSSLGKPLVVMTVLPMAAEDSQTKRNALETLSKLAKEVQAKRIHNLIVVDNAKIEAIYSDVSPTSFFEISNKAIVSPIDVFNTLSSKESNVKPLDSMEWAKILTDGSGLSVYGEMSVTNYTDVTAIAEAVMENLNNGLLATGFDLKQTKYVGIMLAARKEVWDQIPNAAVSYAMSMVGESCGTPDATFHGVYESSDIEEDVVKVYSFFSGLGLPEGRVSQLKKDAAEFAEKAKNKAVERNLNLKLETNQDDVVSTADKIRQQIANKKSAFGGLLTNSVVVDKRKK